MDAAGLTVLLAELKAFRHLVRHAYDLTLRRERLVELAGMADTLTRALPSWAQTFGAKVRREQGWS